MTQLNLSDNGAVIIGGHKIALGSCREKSPSGNNMRPSDIILLWVAGLWASFALYILNLLEQPPWFSHPNVVSSHPSGSFLFRLGRGFITVGALIYFSTSLSITSKYSE